MRKLVLISFLTLDGVMQAPGAKEEDNSDGFKYGGWQLPFFADPDTTVSDKMDEAGAMLIGRKTYDIFAGYWPTEGKNIEKFGDLMNNLPKYVASKTLTETKWQNSHLLKGDTAEAVAKIKTEPGKDIIIFGSGNLCQTLMRHRLIDEYLLMIHPLVLGEGKRLFHEGTAKQDFELVKSKITKMGVAVLTYKGKQ